MFLFLSLFPFISLFLFLSLFLFVSLFLSSIDKKAEWGRFVECLMNALHTANTAAVAAKAAGNAKDINHGGTENLMLLLATFLDELSGVDGSFDPQAEPESLLQAQVRCSYIG